MSQRERNRYWPESLLVVASIRIGFSYDRRKAVASVLVVFLQRLKHPNQPWCADQKGEYKLGKPTELLLDSNPSLNLSAKRDSLFVFVKRAFILEHPLHHFRSAVHAGYLRFRFYRV